MHIKLRRRGIALIVFATAILILAISLPVRNPIFEFFKPKMSMDVRLQHIYTLLEKGRFEDAVTQYRKALEDSPNNADIYYNLGVAFYNLDNMKDAAMMFSKAVKLNNMDIAAHYNLGVTYGETGVWKKAIREYKKVLEIDPKQTNTYYNLGLAYGKMDKWEKARDTYKDLLQRKPMNADAHYNLALIGIILGDKKTIVKEYKTLQRISPELAKEISSIIDNT